MAARQSPAERRGGRVSSRDYQSEADGFLHTLTDGLEAEEAARASWSARAGSSAWGAPKVERSSPSNGARSGAAEGLSTGRP